MKNYIIKFACFFILYALSFYSARAQDQSTSESITINIKSSTGIEYKKYIVKWLKSMVTPATPVRNNMVNMILLNVEFDKMYTEYSSVYRKKLFVPLKKSYFSQHISKTDPMPFQNLSFSIDEQGKLKGVGDLELVYLADKSLKKLPKYTFRNLYAQYNTLDGTYTLVSIILGDYKVSEIDIKGGERVAHRAWRSRKVNNTPDTNCDWFLQTDILEHGKVVKTTTQNLGTSNTVSPPQFKADKRATVEQ